MTLLEQLKFVLPVFEGPLDLMLHLISKHKLNINDIEITLLLTQYLEYIEQMKSADLEVASEFLAMAARLVYIKTASLLPRHEESEELKRELQGQLLEYQLIKQIAEEMRAGYKGGVIFTREPQPLPPDRLYTRIHDTEELISAYAFSAIRVKQKMPPPKTAFSGIVSKRVVSVESRIVYVLKTLYNVGRIPYAELFYSEDKSELVATFLAMLELIKSKRIMMTEDNSEVIFNKSANGNANFENENWKELISSDGD